MTLSPRQPQYAVSIAFKVGDLDIIEAAESLKDESGKRLTRRQVYLAGCKAVLDGQKGDL